MRAMLPRLPVVIVLLALVAGCASERERVQQTEQMLIASGFRMELADTPEKQAALARLPPHKLLMQPLEAGGKATAGYVYADPDVCHCVIVGDPNAYQAFEQLSLQKRLADEYRQAAELQADAAFNWDLWAPGVWGPAPVVVVREREPPPHRP
jgi:hypothetical protein